MFSTSKTRRAAAHENAAEARQLSGVCVVIPARNEAASLPHVLGDLPQVGCILVVDNGSTDETAAVAQGCGAIVVREERRGYGSACLAGLRQLAAWSNAGEGAPEIVVFLDGDYSDHPDLLPELVEPILSDRADFVLGSRLLGEREPGAMPPQGLYGNRLACFLMRMLKSWSLGGGFSLRPAQAGRRCSSARRSPADTSLCRSSRTNASTDRGGSA
jgi:glycosyltransferase involved in cell wall biosynthesis